MYDKIHIKFHCIHIECIFPTLYCYYYLKILAICTVVDTIIRTLVFNTIIRTLVFNTIIRTLVSSKYTVFLKYRIKSF